MATTVKADTPCMEANWRIDGMRAPPRSRRSSMRAATERAIWSISVSPDSRDNSPTTVAPPARVRVAALAAWAGDVCDCVLVILPSQYIKLCDEVYWYCTGFLI